MSYHIRRATATDEPFLWDMLYYAANMADDDATTSAVAKTHPYLAAYVRNWGRPGDLGLIATTTADQQPVGAAWLRQLQQPERLSAAVAADVPELAIAVHPAIRGQGVGTTLLRALLEQAESMYPAVVLSVREHNPARFLYERVGFRIVDVIINRVGGRSYVMLHELNPELGA
jgi:ribosomal protein S18 acetylase RimI-like enzyme